MIGAIDRKTRDFSRIGRHDLEGRRALTLRSQLPEFAEPGLVAPPAFDGRAVDGLARLPETRCVDLSRVAMRRQTRVIPLEAAGGDKASRMRLRIGDQRLVVHLDEPVRRQHLPPMGHQPLVLPDVEHDVASRRDEVRLEIRGENGNSVVDRMASAVDEGRVGKDAMDDAQQHEIVEGLVGDPLRVRPELLQRRQIIVGEAPRRPRGGGDAPGVRARSVARPPKLKFASRRDVRMARQDLLGQGGSRTGQPHDQDWSRILDPRIGLPIAVAGRRRGDQLIERATQAPHV